LNGNKLNKVNAHPLPEPISIIESLSVIFKYSNTLYKPVHEGECVE